MDNSRKKTSAIVLRKTEYLEADRIINLLTPNGKIGAVARGVRKQKSKLAGGIEFFALNEIVLIEGKGELKTISSARMKEFFGEIIKDFDRTDFGYRAIKIVSAKCEHIESSDFFDLLLNIFRSLNDFSIDLDLIRKWFSLKIAEISGEDINLSFDKNGNKLAIDSKYNFDKFEKVFESSENGEFNAEHIKFLRLMISSEPRILVKIKGWEKILGELTDLIYAIEGK